MTSNRFSHLDETFAEQVAEIFGLYHPSEAPLKHSIMETDGLFSLRLEGQDTNFTFYIEPKMVVLRNINLDSDTRQMVSFSELRLHKSGKVEKFVASPDCTSTIVIKLSPEEEARRRSKIIGYAEKLKPLLQPRAA